MLNGIRWGIIVPAGRGKFRPFGVCRRRGATTLGRLHTYGSDSSATYVRGRTG